MYNSEKVCKCQLVNWITCITLDGRYDTNVLQWGGAGGRSFSAPSSQSRPHVCEIGRDCESLLGGLGGCWDLSGIIPNLSQNRPWEQHFFSPKEIEEKEFCSQELYSFHGEKFSLLEVSLLIEKNFKAPWPPNRGFGDGIGGLRQTIHSQKPFL